MARIRTLKAEFFTDPKVAALPSYRCRLTFAGLICAYVDDHGRGLDDLRLIKAAIWPQDDDVTPADVAEDLRDLNLAGLVVRYDRASSSARGLRREQTRATVDIAEKYLALPSWSKHQKVSHPTKSKYPRPPAVSRRLPKDSESLPLDFDLRGLDEDLIGGGARGGGETAKANGRVQAPKSKTKSKPTTPAGKIRDDLERKRARQLAAEEEAERKRKSS